MYLIFGLLFELLLLSNLQNACPDNCQCVEDMLRCNGATLPDNIPGNVSNVYLDSFNLDNLKPGSFEDGNWTYVLSLDIVADLGISLQGNAFVGLSNLEHLGLHGEQLQIISDYAFTGLAKVITLDLSDNIKLHLNRLIKPLNVSEILPAVRNITLARAQSFFTDPVNMDHDLITAIMNGRKIKYFDVTDVNFATVDFVSVSEYFCDSVEYIKAQKINVGYPQNVFTQPACQSLKTLDISGAFLPIIAKRKMDFADIDFNCQACTFYFNIENLYLNKILKKDLAPVLSIDSYVLDITACKFHFKTIEFIGNNLKWINMTVILNRSTLANMHVLNISDNILEYVSPSTLLPSINLEYFNMSYNRLHVMQQNYPTDFEQLFSSMSKLRRLYLSNNGFTDIPKNTFINNLMLDFLDLSYNKLTNIGFNFEHLRQLQFLDLSHNLIKIIADDTKSHFEALHTLYFPQKQIMSQTQQPVEMQVDLSNNDYQCECSNEYLQLIDWLKKSSVVYKKNKSYKCTLDGNRVDILNSAYEETQEYCQAKQALQIIRIAIPTVLSVLLVTIVIIIVLLQKYRKKKSFNNLIHQIQNNTFTHKYLVFLCYCNENGDLVLDKIYPQLKQEISKMTKQDKELVCLGDLHFRPGFAIHNEAMRCIENSAIVVLVVSNKFCKKNWCKMEVGEAYAQRKPIIMLMTERVDTELMSPFLRKIFNRYTHASWVNDDTGGHIEPDWTRLCESMIELASEDQRENSIERQEPDNEYQLAE